MAAKIQNELVKSPGEVTFTAYAVCPDVRKTISPDIKARGIGRLLLVDLSGKDANGHKKNRFDFIIFFLLL